MTMKNESAAFEVQTRNGCWRCFPEGYYSGISRNQSEEPRMTGYIFEHEGKQYDPNGVVLDTAANVEAHNLSMNEAELSLWAQKPNRFVAYIVKRDDTRYVPTTWLGTELGRVIERRRHRNNLTGSRMEYVKIRGNNGALYSGTYGCDWSEAVRLRKIKG
jgi:hypothetical protein